MPRVNALKSLLIVPILPLTPSWKALWFPGYGLSESRAWTSQWETGFAGPWLTPGRILGTRAGKGRNTAAGLLKTEGKSLGLPQKALSWLVPAVVTVTTFITTVLGPWQVLSQQTLLSRAWTAA